MYKVFSLSIHISLLEDKVEKFVQEIALRKKDEEEKKCGDNILHNED